MLGWLGEVVYDGNDGAWGGHGCRDKIMNYENCVCAHVVAR